MERISEELDFSKIMDVSRSKYCNYLEEYLGSDSVPEGEQMWDSDVSYGDYYILVSTPIDLSDNSEKQAKYLAYIIKSISDELDIPMPDFGDDKSNEQIKWSYILKTDAALLHPKAVFSVT